VAASGYVATRGADRGGIVRWQALQETAVDRPTRFARPTCASSHRQAPSAIPVGCGSVASGSPAATLESRLPWASKSNPLNPPARAGYIRGLERV